MQMNILIAITDGGYKGAIAARQFPLYHTALMSRSGGFWHRRVCSSTASGLILQLSKHVEFYAKTRLHESTCPNSFTGSLQRVTRGRSPFSPAKRLLDQLIHLAKIVLIFAHVVDVEKCGEIIKLIEDHFVISHAMSLIFEDPEARATLEPSTIFHAVSTLLLDDFDNRGDNPKFTSQSFYLFLCSDFGWSVYLDTVCDHDPASCRPELVRVVKGTPTNS